MTRPKSEEEKEKQRERLGKKSCRNCRKVYQRIRDWQIFCSDDCRFEWQRDSRLCFYCGDAAQVRDHVIPVKETGKRVWIDIELVPACTECNYALGGVSDVTFQDRMVRLIEKHAKKYDLRMGFEPWSEDEIDVLGPTLQRHVRAGVAKRRFAEERMVFMMQVLYSWNSTWAYKIK